MQIIRSDANAHFNFDAHSNFDVLMLVFGPKAQVPCRIFPAQHWCHCVIWVCSRQRCSTRLPLPPLPRPRPRPSASPPNPAQPRPPPPARAFSKAGGIASRLCSSSSSSPPVHSSRPRRRALFFRPSQKRARTHVREHAHTHARTHAHTQARTRTHTHTQAADAGPRRRRRLRRRRRPRRPGSQVSRAGSGACCLRPAAPGS